MDDKTELLICLSAATAANCVPCFDYYFKKANDAGLDAEHVQKAVELANKVKTGASIFMRKSIAEMTGWDGESDLPEGGAGDHPCCN